MLRWSKWSGVLLLAMLSGLVVFPRVAKAADCVDRMSRIPMAAPAKPMAPRYRANMLRTGPPTAVKTPRARKAKATARKPAVVRKAVHRKRPAGVRRTAPRPTVVAARPRPTPAPVAAAELATPLSYALISSSVCETGPAPIAPMRLAMARAPLEPESGVPDVDTPTGTTFFPGAESPDLPSFVSPGNPGNPGVVTPVPPPEDPEVTPPVVNPPTEPPVKPPTTPEPPITEPPVTPPTGPPTGPPVGPPVGPPTGPPTGPPPTTPVPEPATWALMITGFGLLGLRLRQRRAA